MVKYKVSPISFRVHLLGRMTADFAVFAAFVKFLQFWKLLENWNREI